MKKITHRAALDDSLSGVVKGLSKRFHEFGIEIVEDFGKADVILCSNMQSFNDLHKIYSKSIAILLWTNEPRWSSETRSSFELDGRTIIIMNCYTGDVYLDPYHYLWVGKYQEIPYLTSEDYDIRFKNSKPLCCCIASQHGSGKPFVIGGENIDLYKIRREIALMLNKVGVCDIYGAGWPSGVAGEVSLNGRVGRDWKDWETQKLNLLNEYSFNIAFENTNSKFYITEKLWHPIIARVIPIYYSGNSKVHDVLPKDTFVDYCNFDSPIELERFLRNMSKDEYLNRINKLIDFYNGLMNDPSILSRSRDKMLMKIASKILSFS